MRIIHPSPEIRSVPNARAALSGVCLLALTIATGCGEDAPQATVEGTLRRNGAPLENCLVIFLPQSGQGTPAGRSAGLTDSQGAYRLRFDDQREGVAIGPHRVTVQDLSVSIGVRRRDHGTVDAEVHDDQPPPPVRRSRVPQIYTSPASTPLQSEVKPGHQTIDLDVK